MRALAGLDHPFMFLFAITLAVLAMQKVMAYAAGRAGLMTVRDWLMNK